MNITVLSELIKELEKIQARHDHELLVKMRLDNELQFGPELGDFVIETRDGTVIIVGEICGMRYED
jgi:hypothetical protein